MSKFPDDCSAAVPAEAMRGSGARTKRAAVEAGLRLLAQTYAQGSIRQLKGKVRWEGDLAQWRRSRVEAQEGDGHRR